MFKQLAYFDFSYLRFPCQSLLIAVFLFYGCSTSFHICHGREPHPGGTDFCPIWDLSHQGKVFHQVLQQSRCLVSQRLADIMCANVDRHVGLTYLNIVFSFLDFGSTGSGGAPSTRTFGFPSDIGKQSLNVFVWHNPPKHIFLDGFDYQSVCGVQSLGFECPSGAGTGKSTLLNGLIGDAKFKAQTLADYVFAHRWKGQRPTDNCLPCTTLRD